MHINANCAITEDVLLTEVAAPHAATMYCEMPMPSAPKSRTFRRPSLSMAMRPGNVLTTFTTLVMTERMKAEGSADALRLLK